MDILVIVNTGLIAFSAEIDQITSALLLKHKQHIFVVLFYCHGNKLLDKNLVFSFIITGVPENE